MANHDLKTYKEAITTVTHLGAILQIVRLAYKGLYPFRVYIPVKKIMLVLEDQRSVLEAHYEKYKKIKETKGKVN